MTRARDLASNKTITQSSTAPSSPRTGDLWIDITIPLSPTTYSWSGTAWVAIAADSDSLQDIFLTQGA